MIFPLAFVAFILSATTVLNAADSVIRDSSVQMKQFENGMMSCIRENANPEKKVSLRIIVQREPSEQIFWVDDLSLSGVESFFVSSQQQIQQAPEAVIAVGDFPPQEMEGWIAHYLGAYSKREIRRKPTPQTIAELRQRWIASLSEDAREQETGAITEEDLLEAKAAARDSLVVLASDLDKSARLASYYMDDYVGDRGWLDPEFYFVTTAQLIESITLADLNVQPVVEKPIEIDHFATLPLSSEEAKLISKIFTTMAEKNVVQLLFEKKDLEKKGKKINGVHPLCLLGYLFSDPYLKRCMNTVRKSHFKWENFVNGFSKRMREEYNKDNLIKHVPGFSKKVNVDPNQVIKYIQNRDWEGLARFLL